MLPFDTDTKWAVLEAVLKEHPLPNVISELAARLRSGYEFSAEQSQAAADMLSRSTRDPTPERKRLVGMWESSRQQGVPGLGAYRWDLDQYRFYPDFTYVDSCHGLSGVQTPSTNPVQIIVGPGRTSSKASGVYLVGIQSDFCQLCLCSARTRGAIVKRFHFTSDSSLYMDGVIFKKTW